MTCVHTITNLLLTSYIVFPTVLPRRLVSLRHELDQHLFTVKVAGTGATDLFWGIGMGSVSKYQLSLTSVANHSLYFWLIDADICPQSSITHPSRLLWHLRVICHGWASSSTCRSMPSAFTVGLWVLVWYGWDWWETSSGRHWADQCQTHVMTCVSYLVLTHYRNSFWELLNFNIDMFK